MIPTTIGVRHSRNNETNLIAYPFLNIDARRGNWFALLDVAVLVDYRPSQHHDR
jgi:hypothetical protein